MVVETTGLDVESPMATTSSEQPERLDNGSNRIGGACSAAAGPSRSAPTRRQLRARPSDPAPASSPHNKRRRSDASAPLRNATDKELDYIQSRLAPEYLESRRESVVKEKDVELKDVVDKHDTAVREKFHLERYISIFEGWDPKDAKSDNSHVFLEYKRTYHNLLDLAPSIPPSQQAGPSRHRLSMPSRTTRRRATEQAELFMPDAATAAQPSSTPAEASSTSKGKGKARASDVGLKDENESKIQGGSKSGDKEETIGDMPPPPLPAKTKGKGRRATIDHAGVIDEGSVEEMASGPVAKKKRGRPSLPVPSTTKPRNQQAGREEETASPSSSLAIEEISNVESTPSIPPPPPDLPSLAHLPFPAPPHRTRQQPRGPRKVYYTDHTHFPQDKPRFDGDIEALLESYIYLEDNGPSLDVSSLEMRAAREAYVRNRVNYLNQQGRLLRLLDEDEGTSNTTTTAKSNATTKGLNLPARSTDFQDSLMSHMVQVRNAMLNEAKSKPVVCRRIAKMVQAHWGHIEGREERERLAEERERKKQIKELTKSLRRRWALAVKVIRAKLLQIQKDEQDRLGKEHLQNMLQRSTGLIEAHRDEFAGREEEEETEDEDEDSEGTDDVSAAEDSDEELGDDSDNDPEKESDEDADEVDLGLRNSALLFDREELDQNAVVDQQDRESSVGVIDGDDQDPEENDDSSQSGSEEVGSDGGDDDDDDETESGPSNLLALLDNETFDLAKDRAPSPTDADQEAEIEGSVPVPRVNGTDTQNHNTIPTTETPQTTTAPSTSTEQPVSGEKTSADDAEVATLSHSHAHHVDIRAKVADATATNDGTVIVNVDDKDSQEHVSNPVSRAPSRRKRKITTFGLANGLPAPEEVDPDAADIEFKVETTSDQDEKDRELDEAMEDADENAANSEDEGLLADADLPIEVLLKRYGYEMPNGKHDDVSTDDIKIDVPADQSLTDEALEQSVQSPAAIIEGKRQRRARAVWTPEDNPPPPPKKPKIEPVNDEVEVESEASTPRFTSSEEEDDEDEDADEAEENMDIDAHGETREDTDPNRIRPPFLLRGTLRPYQHDGLEWLASLYTNNMNGILADEMGLGKTIQTIALLAHLACDKGIWGQHLIIVPTSVILNWEMEFKKFLPGMKVLTYYGNQRERKEKRIGWQTQHHFQVCITSYQIVLADQHIFRRKNWVYMILDEAHNIKNFRSQRWQTLLGFKAQKRLLLTGTPLQNNLMELWSLLYFLMPGGVTEDRTSVVGFANHKEFTEWFSNPMDKAVESGEVIDEEMLATVNKLHTLLRPFILRRLKADVEKQLPGKFEHVVHCRLSKRQRFLYDEFMSRASTKEALTSGGYLGVVNTLMQLRKVCNHPDLFEVRPVRTSFAMDPVVIDYEPTELLIRKRLLARSNDDISLDGLNLLVTANEGLSAWTCESRRKLDASDRLPHVVEPIHHGKKSRGPVPPKVDTLTVEGWLKYRVWHEEQKSISRWRSLRDVNRLRCASRPCYGSSFLDMVTRLPSPLQPSSLPSIRAHSFGEHLPPASSLVRSYAERSSTLEPVVNLYAVIPPNAVARGMAQYALPGLTPLSHPRLTDPEFDTLHPSTVKLQIAFPDSSLLQYDCGKLQTLYTMLRDLKANGHRVLIFTQMTRVLDILEMFLSYNGHRYLRLDGSTKIEDRQIITERFNSDSRIFCFIASSRSGGVGINLTGADTVFFYDSDWNPSMDRQCMDRAHRIGQTREVHIYRFVSTHTVEENMLKKANQKRLLDKVVIQEGSFTTDFFGKMDWRDVIGAEGDGNAPTDSDIDQTKFQDIDVEDEPMAVDQDTLRPRIGEERELAKALAEVEDEEDAVAARLAQGEGEMDLNEFEGENKKVAPKRVDFDPSLEGSGTPVTPGPIGGSANGGDDVEMGGQEEDEEEEDDGIGGVDEYMLRLVEWDWDFFVNYRA